MRNPRCLFILACLVVLSSSTFAQDINTNTADFNFVLVPADKVLDIYKKITKSELVMLTDVPQDSRWITLHIVVPREEVSQSVPKLLEQALLKQANIVITKVDEKQVSVAYGKYDLRLGMEKVRQTAPLVIVLTSNDVKTNTVRLSTQPTDHTQNLMFKYTIKSSEEIEALAYGSPKNRAQIMKDGVVVAESDGFSAVWDSRGENCNGLDLLFSSYEQAKLAETALRGY